MPTYTRAQIRRIEWPHGQLFTPVGEPAESLDPDVRWLVVACRHPANEGTIRAYLWSYARLVDTTNDGFGDVCLIVVFGRAGRGDVDGLAQEQAARLRSGLHRTFVCNTYAAAYNEVRAVLTERGA